MVERVLDGIALTALLVFGIYHFKHNKAIFFFIFLYFINYLPTSNFLYNIGSIMAERFMYLPLIAFAAIVVITANAISKRLLAPLDAAPDAQPSRAHLAHVLLARDEAAALAQPLHELWLHVQPVECGLRYREIAHSLLT